MKQLLISLVLISLSSFAHADEGKAPQNNKGTISILCFKI